MQRPVVIAILLAVCAAPLHGAPGDRLDEETIKRVREATVEVLVDGRLMGSGVLVSKDGIVLTAAHLDVNKDKRVELLTKTHGRLDAEMVATNLGSDLLLLRAEKAKGAFTFLELSDVNTLEPVWLSGAAMFRHDLLLAGRVARAKPHSFEWLGDRKHYVHVYYIAGPSPRGTSGGAWVNQRGQVVGIQSGIISVQAKGVGIAFAAPYAVIRELLKDKTDVVWPTFDAAIEEVWEQPVGFIKKLPEGTEGLVVKSLRKDGPLDAVGVKKDDVILKLNSRAHRYRDDLLFALWTDHKPGDVVTMEVLTPGADKPRQVKVKLGALDGSWR